MLRLPEYEILLKIQNIIIFLLERVSYQKLTSFKNIAFTDFHMKVISLVYISNYIVFSRWIKSQDV